MFMRLSLFILMGKFYPRIRTFLRIIVFSLYILMSLSSRVQACGWWGDGKPGDNENTVLVGADGKPLPDKNTVIDDPVEQTRIGDRFRKGKMASPDYELAVYWYRKAAEQGFAGAQNNLGNMYEQGLGVPKDEIMASQWFRRAAENGSTEAQHSLGGMYLEGRGVTQNFDEAVTWFQKAAAGGHHGAFSELGEMYWNGLGVPKNDALAYMWWKLGTVHGDKKSEKMQKMILEKMKPGEISEADKMAEDWLRKYK